MSNKNGMKWIRHSRRCAIYARDGFACVWCLAVGALTLDHFLARSRGGTNESKNLLTSCLRCNSSRKDASPRKWFATLRARGVDTNATARRVKSALRHPVDMAVGRALVAWCGLVDDSADAESEAA